jgi:hypothetical protein
MMSCSPIADRIDVTYARELLRVYGKRFSGLRTLHPALDNWGRVLELDTDEILGITSEVQNVDEPHNTE